MKRTSVSFLSLLLVSVFSILVIITVSFSCGIQDDDFCTNPDSVIAAEINKSKIVLLGESPHSDFILYNGLINILHNWVQMCEKDNSQDFTLNLVLEIDSATASYIDHYNKTGIDSMLYNYVAPFLNMEDIEFYNNLSKLSLDIERLNERRSNKIVLNVLGFEEAGLNMYEYLFRMNQLESERWFVNERDKNVSLKLIEYIKNHSSEHYLLNYGAAHLQDGYVNKNLGFSLPFEESFGYYLIHYIKQEFGEDSIMSFVQGIYIDKVFDNTYLEKYSQKDVLIPSERFFIKEIEPGPNLFRVIRHFVKPYGIYYPHLFPIVFSRFVLEKLSEKIQIIENYLPGYKATQFYTRYMQNIFFITGERLENSRSLKSWLEDNSAYDGLKRIDSEEYASFIFQVLQESKVYNREKLLNELGFSQEDLIQYSKDSVSWMENWKTINRKAKFINSMGIYWIGYPEEKQKAKDYLIEFTGEDHSESQEYLKWMRKKYFNYEDN